MFKNPISNIRHDPEFPFQHQTYFKIPFPTAEMLQSPWHAPESNQPHPRFFAVKVLVILKICKDRRIKKNELQYDDH